MLVESSKDILYLVIAFCVIWMTVFLCWIFYYLMRLLRNTNQIVEELHDKLQLITDGVQYIRGKVEHLNMLTASLTEGVTGLVGKFMANKAKEWVGKGMNRADTTAKLAVDRAVAATAAKMRKTSKKLRK